jgi:hypothetical protein
MIIDNKENHHVVGVGFTAYAINVNIGVKTATKNAATIPLLIRGYFSVTVSVLRANKYFSFSDHDTVFVPPPLTFIVAFPDRIPSSISLLVSNSNIERRCKSS